MTTSAYPPESLGDFVQKLFLHGDTDQAALRHKLALFLYCLLDRQGGAAGQKLNLASFKYDAYYELTVCSSCTIAKALAMHAFLCMRLALLKSYAASVGVHEHSACLPT